MAEIFLASLRGDEGFPRNLIFYLAIAPGQYRVTVDGLAAQGLNEQRDGWARLVVEKPFGRDLASALTRGFMNYMTDHNADYYSDTAMHDIVARQVAVLRAAVKVSVASTKSSSVTATVTV